MGCDTFLPISGTTMATNSHQWTVDMRIETSASTFARQIEGIELWHELDNATISELERLWLEHGVLVFRRQCLDEAELVAFSHRFGDPAHIVRRDWKSGNAPEVTLISNLKTATGRSVGGLGAGELGWHSDQSYVLNPATGSVLYMVEMPHDGGRTYWANLRQAYAALDPATKARIESLEGIYDYLARQSTYDDEAPMSAELRAKTPIVAHPLVHTDPLSGTRSLYLDPTTMTGIVGLDEPEGRALLDDLIAHATQSEFVYEHRWQVGDVVMWDNGFTLHRRDPFDADALRLLKRTTLRLSSAKHIVPETRLFDTGLPGDQAAAR
jgi:alpha-ketoglutarate-dependent taurine dioxygenase